MGNFAQKISRAGLIMLVIGGVLLGVSLRDTITSFQEPKTFEEVLENGAAPGDHVAGRVPYLLDIFADMQTWTENTKTHAVSGKKTTFRYYVLPAGEGYVGLAVSAKNFDAASKLVDQTYSYLLEGGAAPTAELTADARVAAMDKNLVELFRQDLREYYGYTDQDLEALGTPLMVEPRAFDTVRAFCGVGAALLLAGTLTLVLRWRKVSRRIRAEAQPARGPELD